MTWLRVDEVGSLLTHGNVAGFSAFLDTNMLGGDEDIIALLPGELIAIRLLDAPPRSKKQLQSAATYLLEDSLAEDIDMLHVATATRTNGEAPKGVCLAINKSILDAWHDVFTLSGVFPCMLTADFLALPTGNAVANEDILTLFQHKDGILINGPQGGMAIEADTANLVVCDIIEQWSPTSIELYADENTFGLEPAEIVTHHRKGDLRQLAALFHEGLAPIQATPNFLSGKYARKINWQAELAPWRAIGIAATLCLAAFLGGWIADGARADRTASEYKDYTKQIHQTAFPDVSDVEPVQHAREVLSRQATKPEFLSIWLGFADAVSQHDGVQIDGFFYAGTGNDLRVTINADNQPSLDAFKSTLKKRGISAEQGRMNRNRNGQFSGELRVAL